MTCGFLRASLVDRRELGKPGCLGTVIFDSQIALAVIFGYARQENGMTSLHTNLYESVSKVSPSLAIWVANVTHANFSRTPILAGHAQN
jgi:hypothetical protein